MLEKDPRTTKSRKRDADADAQSTVSQMCCDCKWFKKAQPIVGADTICVNPLNYQTYNHFNPSSGDVIRNIICAPQVLYDATCEHWEEGK